MEDEDIIVHYDTLGAYLNRALIQDRKGYIICFKVVKDLLEELSHS